jgi:hypothetical protein
MKASTEKGRYMKQGLRSRLSIRKVADKTVWKMVEEEKHNGKEMYTFQRLLY